MLKPYQNNIKPKTQNTGLSINTVTVLSISNVILSTDNVFSFAKIFRTSSHVVLIMSADNRHNQREVKVTIPDGRKGGTEFVYVNSAYVGSSTSVNVTDNRTLTPPTSVIREQYWACSKWSYGQQMLAVTVGILLGAVIGLGVTIAFISDKDIGDIFRTLPA